MTKWKDKDERVNEIAQAAVDVFLDKGFDGASMDLIAKRAGISKGGIYHHFANKDEILYAANMMFSEQNRVISVKAGEHSDAAEGLKLYIREYITYWLTQKKALAFVFLTFTKALQNTGTAEIYRQYYRETTDFLSGLYQKGIKDGVFHPHDSRAEAVILQSALDGILSYCALDDGIKPAKIIKDFQNKFVNIHLR